MADDAQNRQEDMTDWQARAEKAEAELKRSLLDCCGDEKAGLYERAEKAEREVERWTLKHGDVVRSRQTHQDAAEKAEAELRRATDNWVHVEGQRNTAERERNDALALLRKCEHLFSDIQKSGCRQQRITDLLWEVAALLKGGEE